MRYRGKPRTQTLSLFLRAGFYELEKWHCPSPRIAPDGSKRGRGAAGSSGPTTRLSGLRSDAGAVDRLCRDGPTNQRGGGARTGAGGCDTDLRPGATAGEAGGAVLSTVPCWIAWSFVISVASLSTSCRITASPRDIATSCSGEVPAGAGGGASQPRCGAQLAIVPLAAPP